MRSRARPPRLRLTAALLLMGLATAVFLALALDLLHGGPVTAADGAVGDWLRAHTPPAATQALLALTHLHSTAGIYLMAALAALVLLWRKQTAWLLPLVLAVPGGLLLNAGVKQAFQRARPSFDSPLPALASYSFPSGHTAGATVWWGFLLVLLLAHRPARRWRMAGLAVAMGMIALTALSRIYFGVHHPGDVLAGMAEGVAWLGLCFALPFAGAQHPDATRAGHG